MESSEREAEAMMRAEIDTRQDKINKQKKNRMHRHSHVNWIPFATPPEKEGRYLVWLRQEGSILKGRIGTFWYYPNAAKWDITIPLKDGEAIDLWADVAPPFWTEGGNFPPLPLAGAEAPKPTNIDRPDVAGGLKAMGLSDKEPGAAIGLQRVDQPAPAKKTNLDKV